jgi:universal stress protein A
MVIGPAVDTERVPRSEPATIVHATDFSPQALAAAQHAFSWSQEHQSWITLLHVIEGIGAWTEHERERLEEPFRHWLQELVPAELPIWCEVEHRVEFGRPADKIVATAERLHADLIVIGLTGMDALAENRPGTTALQVISHAPCPVLVVRDYMKTTATQPVADDHQRGAAGIAA